MTAAPNTLAIVNARLLDPATDYDGPGSVVIEDGVITRVERGSVAVSATEILDARGLCLSPGLIDIRVKTGEPGAEPKETLKSAAQAAACCSAAEPAGRAPKRVVSWVT